MNAPSPGPANPGSPHRPAAIRAASHLRATLRAGGARWSASAILRRSIERGDRGDVPGWVLVTVMTAGLVSVLWVVARDRLTEVFEQALSSVLGQ